MGREIVIEDAATEYAESLGFLVRKVQFIGRRGSPDRWFFGRGYVFCIEFKKPGKEPTLQQSREHDRLRGAGVPAFSCSSISEARIIIDSFARLPVREIPTGERDAA